MALGYEGNLYILAFDHRGSFRKKLFDISGREPTPEENERIADAKSVIFDGFMKAIEQGAPKESAGMLVDEEYGSDLARRAKKEGAILAMPVEKSGQDEFDFEFGEDFGAHIEEFDPTLSKVLVRYNPEDDREMNARQTSRLRTLGEWLHERDRKYLFELLVPAVGDQLDRVGGDEDRYDKELRPDLMIQAIRHLQAGGVEPDVWKIEGIDTREDCRRIAEAVRAGGRDGVVCVVLGRGADEAAVIHWLETGAGVPGYIGFAIGRTIWSDPLKAYVDGEAPREDAAEGIAANYRKMIDVYTSAAGA
jgi:myo-inositol catabolism protein IolC